MKRVEIEQLLPGIFRRAVHSGGPLDGLLEGMEGLHSPSEEVLSHLDAIFDPRRTPDRFVPFLARMLDLDHLLRPVQDEPISTGTGHLRELIAAASSLSKERGTAKGLVRYLETAVGVRGFRIDENTTRAFHVRIQAPESCAAHRVLIQKIIEFEKPAYVTYDLEFVAAQPA
jgi:phage tail-like protein